MSAQSWTEIPSQRTEKFLDFEEQRLVDVNSASDTQNDSLTPRAKLASVNLLVPSQRCNIMVHSTFDERTAARIHSRDEDDESDGEMSDADDDELCLLDIDESFQHHLYHGLQNNSFSTIPEAQLPIPVPEILRQTTTLSSELALESVAFAIMGCNPNLLLQTISNLQRQGRDIGPIYPFHMAAAYLNGGSTCCQSITVLCTSARGTAVTKARLINEYGHSVLDSLLLSILRSHTTLKMKDVDGKLDDNAIFPGQEVDICGRWSANSPCYRAFVNGGRTTLPSSWKHKFCHSSAQAVIDSVRLLLHRLPTMRSMLSGLFEHQCFGCGQRLRLGPLHALVMTAFCLVKAGMPEEDLFGVVACYLSMLSGGVPSLSKRAICVSQLLGANPDSGCSHEEMTPHEMAIAIEAEVQQSSLPKAARIGWDVFTSIMRIAEEAYVDAGEVREGLDGSVRSTLSRPQDIDLNVWGDSGMVYTDNHGQVSISSMPHFARDCQGPRCLHLLQHVRPPFGDSPVLGHVWAAIQAEIADYRRLFNDEGWVSEMFSMETLRESLVRGGTPNIGYVKNSLLLPYCRCGIFDGTCLPTYREQIFKPLELLWP